MPPSVPPAEPTGAFSSLDPNTFIDAVASAIGRPLTGLCRPYASYINRVFELRAEDGEGLVAKFYRPDRWSRDALLEEHAFVLELAADEQPVIPPLPLANGATLGQHEGAHFAVFPKKGGRMVDEFTDADWLATGRLLARLHRIGALREAPHRVRIHPEASTDSQLDFLLSGDFVPEPFARPYQSLGRELVALARERFTGVALQRVHGDLRLANLIHRPGEGTFVVDFDDMGMGPVAQDLWLLLPGHRGECGRELGLLLEGYEVFLEFPRDQLGLIEILRAMRFIHHSSWCARQVGDGAFAETHPYWGTPAYWDEEISALERQLARIRDGEA
ncbi:MAG: serine/threonine protein kinase [Spirochaetes bacterium]|nr:serine/threonine protein kinase [Spirochaetota bacterium]